MKALWRKYFHIPTDEPISDRVFMARLTLETCLILLYMLCMAYTAYALFSSASSSVLV